MDEKTPRLGAPFPFMCPTSSPSSAVFPTLQIFPNMQNMQQQFHFYQLMQMVQQQQHQHQRLSAGASPVNSDQASSRSESPQSKSK
ncbi:hypothetical protein GCK72_005555 [Caenorhabditis remanei]|uniref:Uncharacterized protein n=1 Tax=Caenorhabditis remanei TaxID=31234 RepID=A0A6A5HGV7_CAERE|nr:hypothetical protein GCK72_005555 [Caenorhabditis remanei]KAF1765603.1 hypothetical protein GCK72_005555 [Caenorhabditis remanei]